MQNFQELEAAVSANGDVIQSAIVLLKGLADQIGALKPDATAIAALSSKVRGMTDSLASAVAANTVPPEEPTPA